MTYNEDYYQTGTWWWNSRFQAIVKLVYVRNQCDIEIHTRRGVWSVESVWYKDMPTEMHRIKNFRLSMLPDRYEYPEQIVQARAADKAQREQQRQAEREQRRQEAISMLESIHKKRS